MAFLTDEVKVQLEEAFKDLALPVRLAVFSQTLSDPASEEVRKLVEEVCSLDPRLRAEPFNFVLEKEKVLELAIERTPGIAILSAQKDHGIRFYGQPSGYEFRTLVDAIRLVSKGVSGLKEETRSALGEMKEPVKIQVFTTPSCPYCPLSVELAYRFALESEWITADGVEVTGFPDLARRFRVSSVPKTVVGDEEEFVGQGSEEMLLELVTKASGSRGGLVTV